MILRCCTRCSLVPLWIDSIAVGRQINGLHGTRLGSRDQRIVRLESRVENRGFHRLVEGKRMWRQRHAYAVTYTDTSVNGHRQIVLLCHDLSHIETVSF